MRVPTSSGIAAVTVALTLLSLVGHAQAGGAAEAGCCVCNCPGVLKCATESTPDTCREFCAGGGINSTQCPPEFVPGSCAAVPGCPPERGAPALGGAGLTAVALFLTAVGMFGLRRAARRTRA